MGGRGDSWDLPLVFIGKHAFFLETLWPDAHSLRFRSVFTMVLWLCVLGALETTFHHGGCAGHY